MVEVKKEDKPGDGIRQAAAYRQSRPHEKQILRIHCQKEDRLGGTCGLRQKYPACR